MLRQPVVSGLFYPSDSNALLKQISSFFANLTKIQQNVRAIIAPHAGYIYSGLVAAYSYKQIENEAYDVILVLSPSHRAYVNSSSVYSVGNFVTPLGEVEVDVKLAEKLIAFHSQIAYLPELHLQEHALEVQLPFLQYLWSEGTPKAPIVPIVISGELANTNVLRDAILNCVAEKKFLIIASSDLSHFHNYETAKDMDLKLLESITNFKLQELIANTQLGKWEMCGQLPVITTMQIALDLNWNNVQLLKYANSGDTFGDKSRVVGYGAVAFAE